ncbi:hypothetical protein N3K66_003748 [Trichothecium roseum]|uniref:Uncharacterized protein n=1 Tax=Trichothecium roseum TaxID=47278 RepID=A0ACC0V690_9HYPO|nr:hypothetical protein N3K66_003748 [Trichothecium roseum]
MTVERRPVCHRCAQIKQACDGNVPCSRCLRLSLPCRPREMSDGCIVATTPPDDAPKARIKRVQTGCLMCKQRKKKCDEIKPKCGDCRRLCLDCHWPPDRRAKETARKTAAKQAVAEPMRMNGLPYAETYGVNMSEQQYVQSTPSTGQASGMSSLSPEVSQSLVIRGGSPTINTPHSGRADSISSMDYRRPVIKSEFDMTDMPVNVWDLGRASSPQLLDAYTPASTGSSSDSADGGSLSLYVLQLMPQLQSPHDRALLNHYSTIVSSLLSRRSSIDNPYVRYLLPMAQSNELILHCLLALSGNHWRKMQPSMGNRGLVHQGQATSSLARLLPHVDGNNADIALVSSLLLCMTELFDGTSEGWKLHLKGAKRLLAALRRKHGEGWTGYHKFLLRLSRFLDSAATVSTCRPPLMEDEARDAELLEGASSGTHDDEDSAVYGIPKNLFHLVDQINSLADKRKTRVDARSEAVFRAEAAQVEERIHDWPYEYGGVARAVQTSSTRSSSGGSSLGGDGKDGGGDGDALHATLAFQHALRLRLHQIVEGYELDHARVAEGVAGILDNVQVIRYGSPLEACLMFPLVMAGGACWKLEQRVVIRDRLMVMERTCGFGYVYNARDLVERVWARRDQAEGTGQIVNWARIRYEEMHGLVVF